jgi:uncharacterized protein
VIFPSLTVTDASLSSSGYSPSGSCTSTSPAAPLTFAYSYLNDESSQPVIDRQTIPIMNLPASLEGFTIVQLTDIHLYPLTQPETVRHAIELANSLKPDVTVLTGDYVWRELDAIHELAPILSGLNAHHGIYLTLGNHDYWTDATVIKSASVQEGMPMLVNQGVSLSQGGSRVFLGGLDDGWSGHPDLGRTLEGARAGDVVVLLCHEPDLADLYYKDGRISLQLSGHTHAGQIRLPGLGALVHPYLGKKYEMGLYRVGEMWLYTNRGIGCISEPVRFNCPPEVTEFTLVRV